MFTYQKGMTLIELIVGLVIMAAVMLTAVPLTAGWVDSSTTTETRALLQTGYSKTKTLALENSAKVTNSTASAYMCKKNDTVYVQLINETECGVNSVWNSILKSNVTLSVDGAGFGCIGIDNLGLPVPLTLVDGTICTVSRNITITKNGATDARTLY